MTNRPVERPSPDSATDSGARKIHPAGDPLSAMTDRFNWFFRRFARRYFRHFGLPEDTLRKLRELESQGSVVYVMRYASRLDYFLFNFLFRQEGLRLSQYANGFRFFYYRTFIDGLRCWLRRGERTPEATRARLSELVSSGQSLFLFLRTARARDRLRGRREAVARGQRQLDLIAEVLRAARHGGRPVHVVPIALFWRKGPQPARRFVNLPYSTLNRPSDIAKISSFLIAYRDLSIKVGEAIDLTTFDADRPEEPFRGSVRRLRRRVMRFIAGQERVVEGPRLRPRHRVQRIVLRNPSVRAAITRRMTEKGTSLSSTRNEAEKIFREIAASINPSLWAVANTIASWLFRKLFVGIEPNGLDRVARYARDHPVVLVPSHRSYFDFLILSWLFYRNYLVPPHIAARENMAFGPFGFVFRRLGAFFLRRSFDDDLYKSVFRAYLGHLVSEGFTQEFFIEGGRSRTGKSLAPRLGMLSWILEAFVDSGRRDLFFIPIGISYDRLVEESSMVEELEGGTKHEESVAGLVRARRALRHRFGSVQVRFGEPISAAEFLRDRRELFQDDADESERARREVVEDLGNRIVERINWSMVANGTSVAACALLGGTQRGLFQTELVQRMREIADLLRLQDVPMTQALATGESQFADSIEFLLRADLIKTAEDPRGEIYFFEENKRRALDVYRNVLTHFLATPSFAARRILYGVTRTELREDLQFWLDFFYAELFAPTGTVLALHVDGFLDYFERIGVLAVQEERLQPTEKGRRYFKFLASQTRHLLEAYHATFRAVLEASDGSSEADIEKAAEAGFQRAELLGEVERREAWNAVTFRNAMELLVSRDILSRAPAEKSKDRAYARGPSYDRLAGLEERLAASLGAG